MEAVFVVLGFVVVVGVVLLTTGKADPLEPDPGRRDTDDLEGPSPDTDDLRFSVVLRGYRMDEVDAVIERLLNAVAERDAEIQRLQAAGVATSGPSAGAGYGLPRRTVQEPHASPTPYADRARDTDRAPYSDPGPRTSHSSDSRTGQVSPLEPELDVFGRPIPSEGGHALDHYQAPEDDRTSDDQG